MDRCNVQPDRCHPQPSRCLAGTWWLLFGLFLGLWGAGCGDSGSEHFAKARDLERVLLKRGAEITYADPGYLGVAKELEQVFPGSPDYVEARVMLMKIKDARRIQLNEKRALTYIPSRLEGIALSSLAPPQPDHPGAARTVPEKPDPGSIETSTEDSEKVEKEADEGHADSGPKSPEGRIEPVVIVKAPPTEVIEVPSEKKARDGAVAGQHSVTLYVTSWCGYCKKAAAYLKERNVPFVSKNIEKDPIAAREVQAKTRGYGGVPVIDIDGTIIQGFDVRGIEAALARRATK